MSGIARISVERWRQLGREGAWIDLGKRAKWVLRGGDRVRYLNGQVTNDVRLADSETAIYACVTDGKGRVAGDIQVRVSPDGEALWLDAESALAETLGPRLERYIIADDAELEEVTARFGLWHFLPAKGREAEGGPVGGVRAQRLGWPGWDVWTEGEFCPAGLVLEAVEHEAVRIVQGIPRWPFELGNDVFPPEAGLGERAMSYTKGCYIGQEVLSRMKTSGKMPRTLVRWEATAGDLEVTVGDLLWAEGNEKSVGQATSVCCHPETGRWVGLAFVKQGAIPEDSRLLVSGDMPRIVARIDVFPTILQ